MEVINPNIEVLAINNYVFLLSETTLRNLFSRLLVWGRVVKSKVGSRMIGYKLTLDNVLVADIGGAYEKYSKENVALLPNMYLTKGCIELIPYYIILE